MTEILLMFNMALPGMVLHFFNCFFFNIFYDLCFYSTLQDEKRVYNL